MRGTFIKVKKLRESNYHEVGALYNGVYLRKPKIGESFDFFPDNKPEGIRTSAVEYVVEEGNNIYIHTMNSVYRLERDFI